eukprot:2690109-Rhodomonas_salina.2
MEIGRLLLTSFSVASLLRVPRRLLEPRSRIELMAPSQFCTDVANPSRFPADISVYVCTIELLEDVRIQVGLDGGMGGMKAVPLDSAQLLRAAKHGVNIMRFAVDFPQQVLTIHVVGARHA